MEQKSKHEQTIEIVNNVISLATKLGVIHTVTENTSLDGRHIRLEGKDMLFFGSCGYLGLEHDSRLKAAAIEAVDKYGTQFSSSRAYVSSKYYQETESLLSQMFGRKALVLQSLTVGHMSAIPILIGDRDVVVLDSQVHDSVQNAVQLLKTRNIRVELIRHNRMDMLEDRILSLKNNYDKIWYMADGTYSMQGDFAPMKEIYNLLEQHEQLHLYIDDIHGMSWTGPNGTGYVTSQVDYFHPRMILTTGMTKAYGSAGGIIVCADEQHTQLLKNTAKGFIFSIQLPPMVLAACAASAKIHLSNEIYKMQDELKGKVEYFNKKARKLELPLINETLSPITFIGVGKPETGYNMVRRLMNAGFYINLSVFPSVSYNNTGLRIPLNNLLTYADIDGILDTIAHQLLQALHDTNATIKDVYKSFKLVA